MLLKKRASLEISIQAIVIVVLAMTLLGLGLGFIRNMIQNLSQTTDQVTEQVKNRVIDDLITNDKKISFPKTTIRMQKGEEESLPIGIRNKLDATLTYGMVFVPIEATTSTGTGTFDIANPKWFQTTEDLDGYDLPASEANVRNVLLRIPKNVQEGSYILKFQVVDKTLPDTDPSYIYDEKDFFIVVKG